MRLKYSRLTLIAAATALLLLSAGYSNTSFSASNSSNSSSSESSSNATSTSETQQLGYYAWTRNLVSSIEEDPTIAKALPDKYDEKWTLGTVSTAPPMSFLDEKGRHVGVEVALVRAAAQLAGVEVGIKAVKNYSSLITGVKSGRFDVAFGTITDTKAREKVTDIVAYAAYGQGIATQKGNPEAITFDTLCGHTVAVGKGTIQQLSMVPEISKECESEGKKPVHVSAFNSLATMFLAVATGRVDAAMLNEVTVRYYVSKKPDKLEVGDTGYRTDPKGMVFKKNGDLAEAFAKAVTKLANRGVLKEIFAHWGIGAVIFDEAKMNVAKR